MKLFSICKQVTVGVTLVLCLASSGLMFAPLAIAATPGSQCLLPDGSLGTYEGDGKTCCPSDSQSTASACLFAKYINPAISLLSAAVGLVVVVVIIVGGIEYSSSSGDPQKAANGRQRIINALIGLLAYILLYAFLQFLIPGGIFHG